MKNTTFALEPRSAVSPLQMIRGIHWPTFLAGLTVGLVALHLIATRPLTVQVERLQQQVGRVQADMARLSASSSDVEATGSLLAAIEEQRAHVAAARQTLRSIEQLQRDVRTEAARAVEAHQSLDGLVSLNGRLIAVRPQVEQAERTLSDVGELHASVTNLGTKANVLLEGVQAADAALSELVRLEEQLVSAAATTDAAGDALTALAGVRDRAIDLGTAAPAAQTALDGLASLQATLTYVGGADAANNNAERLIALQHELSVTDRLDLDAAGHNLNELIRLQELVAGQTDQVAASIDALDLLSEFQDELHGHLGQVEQLRRQATELMLLETTLTRALTALQPLAELGNLRRLDDAELREVARTLLERRRSRMAEAETKFSADRPSMSIEEGLIERPVPAPTVEE